MKEKRKSYPCDVSDEEWDFCAPYLTLMTKLREIFNALRYLVKREGVWRMMPSRAAQKKVYPDWHLANKTSLFPIVSGSPKQLSLSFVR